MVFSKSYCPYCKATKKILSTFLDDKVDVLNWTIVEIDLMDEKDEADIKEGLAKLTSQLTVPNIFIEYVHVGGNDDIQDLAASGALGEIVHELVKERIRDTRDAEHDESQSL